MVENCHYAEVNGVAASRKRALVKHSIPAEQSFYLILGMLTPPSVSMLSFVLLHFAILAHKHCWMFVWLKGINVFLCVAV